MRFFLKLSGNPIRRYSAGNDRAKSEMVRNLALTINNPNLTAFFA
jgi:hypothetical protein